jgi:hypothetical protein
MSRLLVGAGARDVLTTPGPGEVVAVYRRAVYLRLPGGIVALVAPGVPPGPLWIAGVSEAFPALRHDPTAGGEGWTLHPHDPVTGGDGWALHPHDPLTVGDGWLEVGGKQIDAAQAETWRGPLPDPAALRAAVPLALAVLAVAPPCRS